ncbi:MAG: hypothetical protein CL912_21670 [Deltaproteobacteria bacterium]|nr:hypothetical protein [Deltaproteobacteria bacterium]
MEAETERLQKTARGRVCGELLKIGRSRNKMTKPKHFFQSTALSHSKPRGSRRFVILSQPAHLIQDKISSASLVLQIRLPRLRRESGS